MMVAMGALFMGLGSVFQSLDMTVAALSSLLVAIVYVEIGSPYTYLVWICTTIITAVIYQGSAMWLMYLLLFGIYPILKGYIERLPRFAWWPIKLVFGNVAFVLMFFGVQLITGLPFIDPDESFFGIKGVAMYIATWILLNVALIAFDFFLTVMVRYYMVKVRPKIRKILK